MDNYEATITVHKSPPQQRKQYFDYIEIDDETQDTTERIYPAYKLSKRKNLRVTFSDHIDVDVIEDYESYDEEEDKNSVLEEAVYEIPLDRTKGLRQISSSAEFRSVTENISPRQTKTQPVGDAKTTTKTPVTKTKPQSPQIAPSSQPLLQKRRTNNTSRMSLADLEKKTKEYMVQLHEKTKRAEAQARVARAIFPDISAKVRSQPNYKQFIANARRAVEITRKYERPWVSGASSQNQTVWRPKTESMRRTASLPKNFRLPDNLTSDRHSRPSSNDILLAGGDRQRLHNS
ncbi:uncharacterized protein LOC132750930 [Ruditapes philippinarum]|uniref:uncharacterized protein LOC132750930 n=1 Tax=Ruditapes philippinarum TaxID=129788 RepID=UPI00295AC041|nr:uncharacterized protein LOC132750930 [Ruditapes philippinarum]